MFWSEGIVIIVAETLFIVVLFQGAPTPDRGAKQLTPSVQHLKRMKISCFKDTTSHQLS